MHARTSFELPGGPIPHAVRLLESRGIIVLRMPEYIDSKVDAFSTDSGTRPLVVLSQAKDDRPRSRFGAAHELGHLIMHHDVEPGSKIRETQAHTFAAEFLAPCDQLAEDLPAKVDWNALAEAKLKWGISLKSLVFRASEMEIWSAAMSRRAYQQLSSFGLPEPVPAGPPESPVVLGRSIKLLQDSGIGMDELAAASRLPLRSIVEVVEAGQEVKPKIKIDLN